MGGLGMVELRFNELRDRLDLLGYREPLGLESLPLAERLLADLLQTNGSLKAAKHDLEMIAKDDAESRACVEPYRQDNARLCQELSALHQEVIRSREQHQSDTKDLKADIRRLEAENEDLRFLGGQYKKQCDEAEHRLFRLLAQQAEPQASVTLTGERRPGQRRGRRQRLDISDQLTASTSDSGQRPTGPPRQVDRDTIDLVSAAERRIAVLEEERQAAEEARLAAEDTVREIREKVKSRDADIKRLTGQLEGGRPYRAVLADADSKENDMSRANLPYTELKRANARLEKQLKETVHSQHEAMQRAVELAKKNEALKRELDDLDRIVHALDEDRDKAVRATREQLKQQQSLAKDSALELDAATARAETLQQRAEQQAAELAEAGERAAEAEAGRAAERRRAEHLEAELAGARQTAARLEALLQTMRDDRKATYEKLDRLTENEKHLVLELDRLSRQKTNKARIPDKTQKLIESLEEQRDYFKGQVDELLEQLQKQEKRVLDSDGNRLQTETTELRRRLADCERRLADSAAQLDVRTNESEELRRRLDEALRSLHRLSDSESAAALASTAQLEKLVRTLEHERSLASGDCQRVEQERNELRNKLKVATETQLAERVKMESRIAELEALIGAVETDRTVQHSQTASHRALIASLEAQVKNLQNSLSESQTELTRLMTKNTKMKTFVDRGESSLKDCENQLIKKVGELEECSKQRHRLERQCADLRLTVDEMQKEARRQAQVIEHVVRERDQFQNDVDDKTELLDEHRQQLEKCNSHIVQLEATITNLTADLAASREAVSARAQEVRALRRQLEQTEAQASSSDRHRGAVTEENRRLQQDLTTLTRELQQLRKEREEADQLQEDLKQQVRDYVNEVARVEELLGLREEERSNLLEQYKNLTIEASGLEETNHTLGSEVATLRSELAARDAELSHARDTISLLNDEIQQTSVARQQADVSVSRLNESVAEIEARLQRCESERSRLDRELAACRELNMKLESQRERLTRELTDRDRDLDRVRSESRTLQAELETLRQQLSSERASAHDLETLLSTARGREYQAELTGQQQTAELAQMSERLNTLQNKLEAQKVEAGLYRSQAAERDLEVDRLKRQIVSERFEKERLSQELRRLRRETALAGTSPLPAGAASFSAYGSPPPAAGSRSVTAEVSSFEQRRYTSTEGGAAAGRRSDSPPAAGGAAHTG